MPRTPPPPHPADLHRTHYENFPVASWLCPPRLRPPIAAIYAFARRADDMADEGTLPASERLEQLAAWRAALHDAGAGRVGSLAPAVFGPLAAAIRDFALPVPLLADLLDAFAQDVRNTRDGHWYADRAELLDYCRRSANPVGRLLLHLYGIADPVALAESDAICTALQLANFWQDLSEDIPRGRHYLPLADLAAHGVAPADILARRASPAATQLIAAQALWARATMQKGLQLPPRVPGRAGWELRFVVAGGLRICRQVERHADRALTHRPTVGWRDAPWLIGRVLWWNNPVHA